MGVNDPFSKVNIENHLEQIVNKGFMDVLPSTVTEYQS